MECGMVKWMAGFLMFCCSCLAAEQTILEAVDYGLKADGIRDDGPVIRELLAEARGTSGPVTIRFPENKTVYIESGVERYVFRLDGLRDLTLDGNGSTFLVDKELRFLHATLCENLVVSNLNTKIVPCPTVEATVLEWMDDKCALKVRLDEPERAAELGGPTDEDGEQHFFGMLWLPGKHAMQSCHYEVERVEPLEEGVVKICRDARLKEWFEPLVKPGETRISLPVPGIAHRYGPGPMIRIDRCTNVAWRDVEVWSAPWFAFQVFRNDGDLSFKRVNIRPEPGRGRITSSWRDGFHVKGNKGALLFEDCILEGMNDDAFNISTHAWGVTHVEAADRFQMEQLFPIQIMPMQEDGEVMMLSADGTRRLGGARIKELKYLSDPAESFKPVKDQNKSNRVPRVEVTLDRPIEGIEVGAAVWDMTSANPKVTIRRCRMGNSCRFQSAVTLEECNSDALLFFYAEGVEGPQPSGSVIRNSTLRQGRGNKTLAVSFLGWRGAQPEELPPEELFPLQNIRLENNTFYGGLALNGVAGAVLKKNRFIGGEVEVENSLHVKRK